MKPCCLFRFHSDRVQSQVSKTLNLVKSNPCELDITNSDPEVPWMYPSLSLSLRLCVVFTYVFIQGICHSRYFFLCRLFPWPPRNDSFSVYSLPTIWTLPRGSGRWGSSQRGRGQTWVVFCFESEDWWSYRWVWRSDKISYSVSSHRRPWIFSTEERKRRWDDEKHVRLVLRRVHFDF